MALGLNEVLSKQKIVPPRREPQHVEFTSKDSATGKRLKPWESAEAVSLNESLEVELNQTRAQSAVQRAREIVSKNTLMIDEIHRRRQMDRGMGLSIPQQGPRPFEGLNAVDLELNEQDPVLRLWKRSFWERFSDILH
ncbi:MAG: hypothetical protein A2X86_18930 [Bdellovibrionales bacterium GWA2_49_15]|nr:MAG: hypothetical protein A2X86_18930 [Bdellovibrionales bacterium GWA2_49_15]HAZ14301.1 hypothetical protein [Bdellovibrionales bacterium]